VGVLSCGILLTVSGCPPDDGSVSTAPRDLNAPTRPTPAPEPAGAVPPVPTSPPPAGALDQAAATPVSDGVIAAPAGKDLATSPPDSAAAESALVVASPGSETAPTDLRVKDRTLVRACVLLPLTGESAELGAELKRGIAIAQAEIEGQSWRKLKIEWIEKDTGSTEKGAVAAYHACYGEQTPVIIGPVHPAATTALIPVAEAHNAVLIIPEVGGAIPSKWADHLIAVAPPASQMGGVAAVDATGPRQLRKAAVLRPAGTFGESLGFAFQSAFQRQGGKIVASRELDPRKPDAWRSAALEAGLEGAEALFVVGPPEVATSIVSVMDDAPLAATHTWFIDWAMFPGVIEVASSSSKRRIHWVNRNQPLGEFAETYTTRYQAAPMFMAGAGYDAVMLAAYAAEAAGVPDFAAIAKAAGSLAGLRGAFGSGAVVQEAGVLSLDSAGYRVFEPRRSADGTGPIFFTE